MKKPLSVEANDAKCATAKLGDPQGPKLGTPFRWFSKSSFVNGSSRVLNFRPFHTCQLQHSATASPPHLAFRNQYEVGTPHGKSWHTACAERHAAMPNAHLMSHLDKPFQCWEPMSQLELKLLPMLLPAQRALKLLWKPAVNQIWKTILGILWSESRHTRRYTTCFFWKNNFIAFHIWAG